MITDAINRLWCLKHRPTDISSYVFSNQEQRELVSRIIETKSIPHLLLSGPPGTGKTTLAMILASTCIDPADYDTDVLVINASDNNSVDDIRDMVKTHITSFASGQYKLVILQEADYLSPNAQGILRDYLEIYEQHARFILTCNAIHRIDPAIKSRCQKLIIDAPIKKDVEMMVAKMLIAENIKIPNTDFIFQHVEAHYPDIRSIIQSIQQNSVSGILKPPSGSVVNDELKQLLVSHIRKDEWLSLARSAASNIPDYAWEDVFQIVYDNLEMSPKLHSKTHMWGSAVVTIAEYMVTNSTAAKPGINGAAFFVQMSKLVEAI